MCVQMVQPTTYTLENNLTNLSHDANYLQSDCR